MLLVGRENLEGNNFIELCRVLIVWARRVYAAVDIIRRYILLSEARSIWLRLLWACMLSLLFAIVLGGWAAYWKEKASQELNPMFVPALSPVSHSEASTASEERFSPAYEPAKELAPALELAPSAKPPVMMLEWGREIVVARAGRMRPAIKGESSWGVANEICIRHGGRLPSAMELQLLWSQHTVGRPRNVELCQKHGWPLYKLCGGEGVAQAEVWASDQVKNGIHAAIDLFTGMRRERSDVLKLQLVCLTN